MYLYEIQQDNKLFTVGKNLKTNLGDVVAFIDKNNNAYLDKLTNENKNKRIFGKALEVTKSL